MEERRRSESGQEWKTVRRGWCLGWETFREELLEQMSQRVGEHHFGEERAESAQARAERIVWQEMKKAGWREGDWERMRKGDAAKLALAWRLRAETTVPLKWIAQRLQMGAWTYLNNRLYWERRSSR